MHIVIVGCGRVGAELARSISGKGHEVEIIDPAARAFGRLGSDFKGRALQGSGIDRAVLERASIERANAFVAVTSSDNTNFVAARIAKDVYRVPMIVARAYNPQRLPMYERFGIQTVASSSWGARRLEDLITCPAHVSLMLLGNGEVEVVEARVPERLSGRRIAEVALGPGRPVGVTRGGRARLAEPDFVLQAGDMLCLAVPSEDMPRVTQLFALEAKPCSS
jgi:trk system potassium uptake protein TrkA